MYNTEFLKQKINLRKEYRIGMDIIAKIALDNNAIIYGGYVRDKILREYNTELYFENNSGIKKSKLIHNYWNPKFDEKTKSRLILPKDIDICFKTSDDLDSFVGEIEEKFDNLEIPVEDEDEDILKFKVIQYLGKTFSKEGETMTFHVDLRLSSVKEPPFDKLDFITNSLIMEQDNLRISKNCGISMNLKGHNMYLIIAKIIEMILSKKTYIVKKINNEYEAKVVLQKMIDMICYDWEILNLQWITRSVDPEINCTICLENNTDLCILNASCFHYKCMCKYIKNVDVPNIDGKYYFNGPYREKCILEFEKIKL
jgi:hypothetical protein